MCAIYFFYYYFFQNSGAPNDNFPLNALKTLLRLSWVLQISKNAFEAPLIVRRAKSEALDNIYNLLILNIKSCKAKRRRQRDRGTHSDDGFLKYIQNTFLAIHKVLLALQKCILRGAINRYLSVRPFQGNLSLFEITRNPDLFSRKFQVQFNG